MRIKTIIIIIIILMIPPKIFMVVCLHVYRISKPGFPICLSYLLELLTSGLSADEEQHTSCRCQGKTEIVTIMISVKFPPCMQLYNILAYFRPTPAGAEVGDQVSQVGG